MDKRADIWAFGAVLFEMLTGRRLFTGSTLSEGVARGPLTRSRFGANCQKTRRATCAAFSGAVFVAIPSERLRDIGEARIRLRNGEDSDHVVPSYVGSGSHRFRSLILGTAALLLVVGGFLAGRAFAPFDRGTDAMHSLKLDLALKGLTLEGPGEGDNGPRISPDGSAASLPSGGRAQDSAAVGTRLDSCPRDRWRLSYPFWSPDGRNIAYVRQGR